MRSSAILLVLGALAANAHMAVWDRSMYCFNDTTDPTNQNANSAVNPLFNLKFKDGFINKGRCGSHPPNPGHFLELRPGQDLIVPIATNRAVTQFSYNGKYATGTVDGKPYPGDPPKNSTKCITDPNLHTPNEAGAAGTAFAISYVSDLDEVTIDNLAVFSIAYGTPWYWSKTSYPVPKALPACPPNGCICVWGWVPNGCGQANIYMLPYRCKVIGATSTVPVAVAKPPVWCQGMPDKCTTGAKQMIFWNQQDGNNIEVSGNDLDGMPKSPAYNAKCGWANGAQNDIFGTSGAPPPINNGASSPNSTVTISASTSVSAATSASTPQTSPVSTSEAPGSSATQLPSVSVPVPISEATSSSTSQASASQPTPEDSSSTSSSAIAPVPSVTVPDPTSVAGSSSTGEALPVTVPVPTSEASSISITQMPPISSPAAISHHSECACTTHGHHNHIHGHHKHRRRVEVW